MHVAFLSSPDGVTPAETSALIAKAKAAADPMALGGNLTAPYKDVPDAINPGKWILDDGTVNDLEHEEFSK